jgi:hypothetical protein
MAVSFPVDYIVSGFLVLFLFIFPVYYPVDYHALNPDGYCQNNKYYKNSKKTESADFECFCPINHFCSSILRSCRFTA